MAAITHLSDLKPFKSQWRIHVKILKLWKQFLNGVATLEIVIVNEKTIINFWVTHNGVSFTDIHEGKQNPDFLIDIVGQIVEIGDVEILNINRKQIKRLTMTLRDGG
ncbi:unnamed protein product [Thlaspi arvense]|uniref:Replication protein A 70 kDa DNA-binding subunit B/D first OB fold domain-containing protein n=1 Tax=Thlaspi arvense TaxID=13288 RepID=A0AAU9SDK5_THLAR|nr:unnamed protein product [Thlaspi arvense]